LHLHIDLHFELQHQPYVYFLVYTADLDSEEEDSKPAIEEDSKPAIEEDSKPAIEEDNKPAIEEESKPVIEEDSKPAVEEVSKPAVEELESATAKRRSKRQGNSSSSKRTRLCKGTGKH